MIFSSKCHGFLLLALLIAVFQSAQPVSAQTDARPYTNEQITMLQSKFSDMWDGFVDALLVGDIKGAVQYIGLETRERYGILFNQMTKGEVKNTLTKRFHCPEEAFKVEGYIECEFIRSEQDGVDYSFPVFIVNDYDGQWRIGRF